MPYALRYTYYETGDPPYCTYDFAGNTRGEALHSYFDALADLTYDRQMEVVAAGSVTVTLRHSGGVRVTLSIVSDTDPMLALAARSEEEAAHIRHLKLMNDEPPLSDDDTQSDTAPYPLQQG
jgi:hypothetical protein